MFGDFLAHVVLGNSRKVQYLLHLQPVILDEQNGEIEGTALVPVKHHYLTQIHKSDWWCFDVAGRWVEVI